MRHLESPSWWDQCLGFVWQHGFQPAASLLVTVLQWTAYWLPTPFQGRSLVLIHNLEPHLAGLLTMGALLAGLLYMPRRWYGWMPEKLVFTVGCLAAIPFGLVFTWGCVVAMASLLYFVFGWTNWQLGLGTMGGFLVWGFILWIRSYAPETKPNTSHGSADWESLKEAIRLGRITPKGFVFGNSHGFTLGHMPEADPKTHDTRLRYMGHVLTCAPTGAGKGIGAVIPNLLEYPGSALVLDIKGENYAVTHRARAAKGNAVFLIDPFGVTGQLGHGLNWLDTLNPNDPNVVSDSAMLADMMIISDTKDSYWDDAARDLIRGLLIHVAGFPEADRNMGEVRRLLTSGEERLRLVLQEMSETQAGFGIVARTANSFLLKADRERSGVLSTAIRHTAFLDDPRIVEALSRSDFDLRELKRKRMTVFVALPPSKLTAYNRFLRGVVGLSLAAVTNDTQKPEYNVVFLLDEFGQLGRMAAIEDAISLVRGYGVAFWIFVQDLSQLKGVYPKWQTFLANTAKQFFGTADLDTARYISNALGNYTATYHTTSQGVQSSSSSEHRHSRPMLSPDEVMRMGSHRPIILIGGERPYLLNRLNYLQDKAYQGVAEKNPFHQ
jgi:type IV secretory pathway TraG/TraD family ATPase VirD4